MALQTSVSSLVILKWLCIAANAALAGLLLAMGLAVTGQVVDQYRAGYVPAYMPQIVGLGFTPLVLAAAVTGGIVVWLRTCSRRLAVLADGIATMAVWTLLVPLLFLPGNLLPVGWALAPACTILTLVVAWRTKPAART